MKVKSLSRVRLFATPWTVAYQAPPSMGFSRQEHWSGLPFPSPGDLPKPGIKPGSPALQADSLTSEPPGKPSRSEKEINCEYSLEGLILKLQYFGHLMWRADSLEKTLMLEKIEGGRRRVWQEDGMVRWHHRLNGHEFKQTPGDSGQDSLACCSPWDGKVSDRTWWLNSNRFDTL